MCDESSQIETRNVRDDVYCDMIDVTCKIAMVPIHKQDKTMSVSIDYFAPGPSIHFAIAMVPHRT